MREALYGTGFGIHGSFGSAHGVLSLCTTGGFRTAFVRARRDDNLTSGQISRNRFTAIDCRDMSDAPINRAGRR